MPLVILAGKEYGTGSSRDWAAKGTLLLGVRAVIAESFERIHRSNLVGMGVLPLVFEGGQNAEKLGLTGRETYTIQTPTELLPRQTITVVATREDGSQVIHGALTARHAGRRSLLPERRHPPHRAARSARQERKA